MATLTNTIKKPLIVFDVNETLLDLESVNIIFDRIFYETSAMRLWFTNLILYSEALTLAGSYVPFTEIGAAVLQMMAKARGISISDKDKHELVDRFASMPPHPDVPPALQQLRDAGFRLFTLTDNLLEVQTRQLTGGGIVDLFERRFSVDQSVRRHKPAPEAYAYVEAQLGTRPEEMMLVASHTWDTIGALGAGWQAALIKRPYNETLGVGPQPTLTGSDLADIAHELIGRVSA